MTTRGNLFVRWARWGAGRWFSLDSPLAWSCCCFGWPESSRRRCRRNEQVLTPTVSDVERRLVPVRLIRLPLCESAVGTIRAVHETTIGSKLLARVVEVNLKAGQKVQAGDVLVRLDDTDLRAKLQQAKAAVASAEAVHRQAAADERRYAQLVRSRTISQQQYENAVATLQSAEADLHRAQAAVNEVQATLDWATIRSPIDGTVIDKKVDVGDMVTPGQMLVTLFDPKHMQLVASVRESLTHRLQVGQSIGVQVEGLSKQCSGTVSEIVPESQSASRSFQVKVTGPCPAGIYTGMFGRILIPLQEERVLVIPRQAVQEVGQLELVEVVKDGRASRRTIRTGWPLDENVEVLSGLREGEQVTLPAASARRRRHPVIEQHAVPAEPQHNFTNRIVKMFLESNLSIILILLASIVGLAALGLTPREEDPQIVVPLADVYVNFPGHSAAEVEQLATTPLEKILYQIDGVEYVYSMSRENQAIITVRYYVGEDRERSLVKLYKKLDENLDIVPPGVTGWVVKPVEIDDVPVVTLTLASNSSDDMSLRRVAEEVTQRLAGCKRRVAGVCRGRTTTGRAGVDGPGPNGRASRLAVGIAAIHRSS